MTRRLMVALIGGAALALLIPGTALAAHPLRYVIEVFEKAPSVLEANEDPCGIAVDSHGDVYVSDYYHDKVHIFNPSGDFITQMSDIDLDDGPCGLAVDPAGTVFANLYHGGVVVLKPSSFPPTRSTSYANSGEVLSVHATGIALEPASGNLLLNQRTVVAEYQLPLETDEAPLRTIGAGSLEDGYGLAVSGFPGTAGRVYVADAATADVKVYDPTASLAVPVAEFDGEGTPLQRFNDLTDSVLAVNDADGHLLVADNIDGPLFEHPRAVIAEFDASGTFTEQLGSTVIHGEPVGLAVDNTGSANQGGIYVTSGNSEKGLVLAFGASTSSPQALANPLDTKGAASASAAPTSASRRAIPPSVGASSDSARERASASTIAQKGEIRISVSGKLSPKRLPRRGTAPVSVTASGQIDTTDGGPPPQLRRLTVEINRHGRFDFGGLPVCPLRRIQPASTARALAACRPALVGEGSFSAETSLSGGELYPTRGRLLLFNARRQGRPVLYGHIYATRPFTSSHVIPFEVRSSGGGTFGSELSADIASSLGSRSRLTGIEMRLFRLYRFRGSEHSFLSAGCPAPPGFRSAVPFPLTRTSFAFTDGKRLSATLSSSCHPV